VMRWQAFLMGMPFFCVGMLFIFKDCWKVKWRVIAGLAILFASAFAMHDWNQKIYQAPEYADFVNFQGPRVTFGDNRNYNQNAVYEDAEELGLSGKDFHMLTSWIFYDTEAFSASNAQKYTVAIPLYKEKIHPAQIPHNLLNALAHSLRSPLFWTWFVFCIIVYCTNRTKFIYLLASLCTILGLMAYLQSMGRLVYRVESGFWLYAAVLAIPLFGTMTYKFSNRIVVSILAFIAIVNIYSHATSQGIIRSPVNGSLRTLAIQDSTNYKEVFDFIDSNPDKIFFLSMNAFMRFSHHKNPPYLAEPIGSYRNTISFGYWTPHLPEIKNALSDFGIQNPIKDVIHDNVIVINEPTLSDHLQRLYYDSIAVDTLKAIGEMIFYKYRLISDSLQ